MLFREKCTILWYMESTFARGKSAPSKKVVALGIFVVTIIAVVVIFKTGSDKKDGPTLVFSQERTPVNETDSDNDGLKDWQEALYNTNPKIADTDGDGIRDKEDIEKEQAEKAEEERELLAENVTTVMAGEDWESLGYSQTTSRLLLAQYLSYKDPGEPLKDEEINSIVRGLPTYKAPERSFTPFTSDDIVTTDTNTSAALHAYGNAFALILDDPSADESAPNELIILQTFAQSENGDTFIEELTKVVAQYTYVLEGMQGLTVPSLFADEHLLIMNRMGVVRNDFEVMQSLKADPYTAIAAISAYGRDSSEMAVAFDALRQAFDENGVEFEDSEPGKVFNN